LKIRSIETLRKDDHLAVVLVHTDSGATGIGQTSPYIAESTEIALHQLVAPFFLGRDPWDLEALLDECVRVNYKYLGTSFYRALCGVDTALWDLLGQVTGQPVYKLLGGTARTEIPLYASSLSREDADADLERLATLVQRDGFRAVKIKVGDVMGRDRDAAPGRTERIIARSAEVLGEGVTLMADANGAYTPSVATQVGRILEEHGFVHYEEPCPFQDLDGTKQVADALDIPVAGGEQDNALATFHRLIAGRCVDVVQPDIGYIGGVSRARKVAHAAEIAGIPCTPHCANNSMLQVFTAHLAAAMPSATQFQEWSIESTPWTEGVYSPMPLVENGHLRVTGLPGWGIQIDPEFTRTAIRRQSSLS
jgi:L-alanine-DL-glutamate epimerase-like enolase superfamily enzyme